MSGDHHRKWSGTWGERVIKNGTIRWYGRILKPLAREPLPQYPPEPAYDGSLDGLRGLFYTYEDDPTKPFHFGGSVFLWGFRDYDDQPNVNKDGYLCWTEWAAAGEKP